MRRLTNFAINCFLVIASLAVTDFMVHLLDLAAGAYLSRSIVANHLGLLFDPGAQSSARMHDYATHESINSLGFRDNEVSLEKTHRYRIVAIGDSFTYGWGVNLEDTWCKRLEQNLRGQGLDVEVLNLGEPASGPQQYAQMAELVIPILKPDLVIVGILNGDDLQQCFSPLLIVRNHHVNLVRLVHHLRSLWAGPPKWPPHQTEEQTRAQYAQSAKQMLDDMRGEVRARYDALEPEVKRAYLDGTLNPWLISHATGEPGYFMNTVDLKQLRLPVWMMSVFLNRIRKSAEHAHAGVMAVSIPEGFYVNKEAFRNVQRIGFQVIPEMLTTPVVDQAIEKACAKAGMPFCSVLDEMRAHADEKGLYLELDRHFASKGNALYADVITPCVSQRLLDLGKPTQ